MNILSIKETCIYVEDLDRTKEFYAGKLGLPLIALIRNRHVFFKAGNSVLLCFIAEATEKEVQLPPHGTHGVSHFAFEVSKEEYPAALEQIKSCDIEILHEHAWKNNIRSFYFLDPDGNLVEIIEQGL
ncbi:MAG TPA: VOC family protein [Flavisolibacter sp.]|jgi:catechol 2,3-dioxygenase-like lactoylglutathione lyase family enzyme|nr:VOC family protein [Flavisolibacter sp.]